MSKNISALFFLVIFIFAGNAYSQNCIPVGGPNPLSYSQNFDALGNSPSPQASDAANVNVISASGPRRIIGKFDNAVSDTGGIVNVSGWALFEEGTNISSVSGRHATGSGDGAGGNGYSFAPPSAPTDRAFGSLNADEIPLTMVGACFVNQNAVPFARVIVSYTGEMYRRGAASGSGVDSLSFEYGLNASNIFSGTFTPYSALNFTTPNTTGGSGARDGNNAAYRTVFPANVIDVVIQPGDTFFVRWIDHNIVGNDDGLSIDDFSIQFLTVSAAPVSVSGRVIDGNGSPVRGAVVSLSMGDASRPHSVRTNSFGFYRFTDLPSGGTAILTVQAKARGFRIPSQIVNLDGDLTNVDFVTF